MKAYAEGRDADEHLSLRPRRWKDKLTDETFTVQKLDEVGDSLASLGGSLRKYQSDYVSHVTWLADEDDQPDE
jgi:hypothetical protein